MPVSVSYPGVYVEEIPSGVRTITGVSTSVTAFAGMAPRGPVNRAVRVLSWGEYERRFGGLDPASEMSYAVRQFFTNGGRHAVIVRVALGPAAAATTLVNADDDDVLTVTAVDQGESGNTIEVQVEWTARRSNFTLRLLARSPGNPAAAVSEEFTDLSMDAGDPRFVETVVNGQSELVVVKRNDVAPFEPFAGGSTTGDALPANPSALITAQSNQFRVSVDGGTPETVTIPLQAYGTVTPALTDAIRTALPPAIAAKVIVSATNDRIVLTSRNTTAASRVRVLPGLANDASRKLKLGVDNGGSELDAAAVLRPKPLPAISGVFTSGTAPVAALTATSFSFQIGLDGQRAQAVDLTVPPSPATRAGIAADIQLKVRALKPNHPAYAGFTCGVAGTKLVLTSGTRGGASLVTILPAAANDVADALLRTAGYDSMPGADQRLSNGTAAPFQDNQAYGAYIRNVTDREGIYALEAIDLFNLLCLPGVSDAGILSDAAAYCERRRAMLIVDAPKTTEKPDRMLALALGTDLPKTSFAAVYYPWIRIADPLANGKVKLVAPSGTIAGLYARTDGTRGVWKAPAGADGPLTGVRGVAYPLTDDENGLLNPRGVNCIRQFPVHGVVSWGARTLLGDDQRGSEWKYVPVRRTALYIEESLYRGLQWVVFEPNDEPLWGQIRLNVGAFMHGLFRQGAFQGIKPADAFFVKCDSESTTQDDINHGIVNIVVGFAPLKPAEFVVIKIQQMAGQIQT